MTKGIEQSPLLPTKTPISETRGTESGTRSDKNDSSLAWLTEAWPNLPEPTKKQIIDAAKAALPKGD